MKWDRKADQLLIKLWDEGWSLTYVAAGMRKAGYNFSRSAISGRRHRLPPGTFTRSDKLVRTSKVRVKVSEPHIRKPSAAEVKALEREGGVEYFDNVNGCMATLDRIGDWCLPMVCGQPRDGNRNYCAIHFRLYHHTQPMRREQDGKASEGHRERTSRTGGLRLRTGNP